MGNLSIRCGMRNTGSRSCACPQRSSASMSFSCLFLGGLVSTRARFRFTNREQHAVNWLCRSSILQRTANYLLTVCLTPGGKPRVYGNNPGGVPGIGAVFYKYVQLKCPHVGPPPYYSYINTFITTSYTGPDNTSHPLRATLYTGTCDGITYGPTSVAADGSGLSLTVSSSGNTTYPMNATVTLANGTVITPPTIGLSTSLGAHGVWGSGTYAITDTNNNQIKVFAPA